ncbi:hypothetical protein QZH41_012150 [Actinostola sp. cb2023]|nr:hypothetical protein QZH41_012150 [Actinostola sp. cb2023]
MTLVWFSKLFEDIATERTILLLKIKCPNDGCTWQGELGNLQEHKKVCPKCPVSCPNNCGRKLPREKVTSHKSSECPLTIVPCSYESFGCNFKGKRQDLNDHVMNSMSEHLTITTQQLLSLKNRNQSYFSFIWKVKDFSQQLQNAKQEDRDIQLYSEPFHSHTNGHKLKLRLDPNGYGKGKGTHVSVYLIVMRSEYDAILTWPFDWKVKLIILDQKPDNSRRKNIENEFTPDSTNLDCFKRPTTDENTGKGYHTFVSHETLATENYVVDGTLFLQLELEKP